MRYCALLNGFPDMDAFQRAFRCTYPNVRSCAFPNVSSDVFSNVIYILARLSSSPLPCNLAGLSLGGIWLTMVCSQRGSGGMECLNSSASAETFHVPNVRHPVPMKGSVHSMEGPS